MQTTEIGCQQRLWLPPICNGDLPNWGFCAQLQSLFNCRTHGLQFYRIKGKNVNQAEITTCYFVLHFKTYCEIDFLLFFEHFLWFLHSSWFENLITFKPWATNAQPTFLFREMLVSRGAYNRTHIRIRCQKNERIRRALLVRIKISADFFDDPASFFHGTTARSNTQNKQTVKDCIVSFESVTMTAIYSYPTAWCPISSITCLPDPQAVLKNCNAAICCLRFTEHSRFESLLFAMGMPWFMN